MNLKKSLVITYLAIWVVLAINPVWPYVWFIENLLLFVCIPFIWSLEKRYAFSRLSSVLIFLFIVLHTIGAHYTYSKMPGMDFITHFFDFQRNNYDRFVHFMFGFLIFLPLTEVLAKSTASKKVTMILALAIIFAVSGIYEIFEWIAAEIVEPQAGLSVLGSQGDEWDAQKDMTMAHLGAIAAAFIWHKSVNAPIED